LCGFCFYGINKISNYAEEAVMVLKISIRSADDALGALLYTGPSHSDAEALIRYILDLQYVRGIFELAVHNMFSSIQLPEAAEIILEKGKVREALEFMRFLSKSKSHEEARMFLLKRVIRQPLKKWLYGKVYEEQWQKVSLSPHEIEKVLKVLFTRADERSHAVRRFCKLQPQALQLQSSWRAMSGQAAVG
jgi:hypothetical protein